jgi:putative membrane protein
MIKNFLKGMVMGLANIIPGVSGGTMAVSMGIYDKLIHCLTHLFKEFKESILFVLPIILGMGVALVGLSFVITPAFEHFPLQTNCLFIGLIIGGIPAVWKKVKGNKISISHILAFLLFFALVIAMAAMGESEGQAADLSLSLWSVVKLFLVGVIASATMVIPGVSGSMVLLVIGYYNPIVATIKEFAEALAAFNMSEILRCCGILVPMGIGVVIGIFAIAKIIEIIFQKFPLQAYWAIIGLIVASPFAILMVAELGTITALAVLGSVVTFALGFVIAMKLGE